jgi:hypothetical protein
MKVFNYPGCELYELFCRQDLLCDECGLANRDSGSESEWLSEEGKYPLSQDATLYVFLRFGEG